MTYIIDASIVVKWLLKEPHRHEAIHYLEMSIHRISPDLILLECLNAIRRKLALNLISESKDDQCVNFLWDKFQDKVLFLVSSKNFIKKAYALSKELQNHPIPDCIYLAVAIEYKTRLVAADKKLFNRVSSSHYSNNIKWIEEPIIL